MKIACRCFALLSLIALEPRGRFPPSRSTSNRESNMPIPTNSTYCSTWPARRRTRRSPAVLCIHGGGFRAGKRDRWDKLCSNWPGGLRDSDRDVSAGAEVSVSRRRARCQGRRALVAGQFRQVPDRPRANRRGWRFGRGHLAQFLGVTGDVPQFEGTGGNAGKSRPRHLRGELLWAERLYEVVRQERPTRPKCSPWLGGDDSKEHHRHILPARCSG